MAQVHCESSSSYSAENGEDLSGTHFEGGMGMERLMKVEGFI